MKKQIACTIAALGIGSDMACTVRALPPFKIDVSLWDIAVA